MQFVKVSQIERLPHNVVASLLLARIEVIMINYGFKIQSDSGTIIRLATYISLLTRHTFARDGRSKY